MTSVNKFTSFFSKDLGRLNNFKTSWTGGGVDGSHLEMACKSISMPGITLQDGVYDGRKFAVGYDLDSFSASFYIDAEGKTLKELSSWSNRVFNQKTGKFGWKDDYACTVQIDLLKRDMSEYNKIKIFSVFPVNLSNIELSWDSSEVAEYTVSFDFDEFQIS